MLTLCLYLLTLNILQVEEMVFINSVFVFVNFEPNILQVEKMAFVNLVIGCVRALRPIFFVNFVFVFVNFEPFAGGEDSVC